MVPQVYFLRVFDCTAFDDCSVRWMFRSVEGNRESSQVYFEKQSTVPKYRMLFVVESDMIDNEDIVCIVSTQRGSAAIVLLVIRSVVRPFYR
jgi:hypothetical protein